jgi:hypothetical protein
MWSAYILQKNMELSEIVSEDDTDSHTSETAEGADVDVDSYFVDTPTVPLLDSPASTSPDFWGGELDLGVDFGLDATFP